MHHLIHGARYLFRGLALVHRPGIRRVVREYQDALASYLPTWIIWLLLPLYFLVFWVMRLSVI